MLYMCRHTLSGSQTETLLLLATWVAQVYLPLFFSIKVKHLISDGSRHLLMEFRLWRQQHPKVRAATEEYLRMEAWWAHPEPILVSLLTSQDLSERTFAVDKILSVRMGADVGSTAVRSYKVPDRKLVNLNATSCVELIEWENVVVTEPIFTASLTTAELRALLETPLAAPRYSLHTQSCERAVKSVTEAAKEVCGWERRHRLVLARTKHRRMMPKMKTKRQHLKVFHRKK